MPQADGGEIEGDRPQRGRRPRSDVSPEDVPQGD
jgi:hypothetical protein